MSKQDVRRRLLEEQGGRCAYCFNQMTIRLGCKNTVTRDHVKPRAHGGPTNKFNIVGCDYLCNMRKGAKTLYDFLHEITGGKPECHPMSKHIHYIDPNVPSQTAANQLGRSVEKVDIA